MEVTGGGNDAAVRAILKARLRGIVLYGDTLCHWAISLSGGAATLISESMKRLTGVDPDWGDRASPPGRYRNVSTEEILGFNPKTMSSRAP